MMICGKCGTANPEGSAVCSRCGAMLPETQPKKRRIARALLISGGGLLAVLLVVGVVLLLLAGSKWDLASAWAKTITALRGSENRTQVQVFLEDLNGLLQKGDYTVTLGNDQFSLSADHSRDSRVICGTLSGLDQELTYSLDEEALQFTIPDRFENVYGIGLKKAEELLNNPLLAALMGSVMEKMGISTDTLTQNHLETSPEEAYNALRSSFGLQELERMELNGQRCQVFEITWSSDALEKLILSLGTMPEVQELLASLIPDLGSECRCYVNKHGYIAGLEFTGTGSQCLITLEGSENPWDAVTLTLRSVYGETTVYTGGLERSGSAMNFCLENEAGIFLDLTYDDAAGEFALRTRDLAHPLSGRLRTGSALELDLAWETETQGPQQLSIAMAPLSRPPAPLSEHYIDMLDMNTADWTRFLLDLGI